MLYRFEWAEKATYVAWVDAPDQTEAERMLWNNEDKHYLTRSDYIRGSIRISRERNVPREVPRTLSMAPQII